MTHKALSPLETFSLSRRRILQASGALIMTAAGPLSLIGRALAETASDGPTFGSVKPPLNAAQLDSWIAIAPDGRVTAFFGKIDQGQGVDVAVAQIVAEELDVALSKVAVIMGDSASSINQGGASNSTGVKIGAQQLRIAAAEARLLLVQAAATKLNVASDTLTVDNGVVMAKGDPAKKISYADLIGGLYFDHQLDWNKKSGNALELKGKATPKNVADYKIVGTSQPRDDVAGKVYGVTDYVTEVRLPDMLHARTLRPPIAGGVPASVDESSIKGTGAKLVRQGDFLAVVAAKEWDAIRAARMLKVSWKSPTHPLPAQDELYDHIRKAKVARQKVITNTGDVDAAFTGAAKTLSSEYEWPFQSHAIMGPSCAVAEINGDRATVFTGSQKPHYVCEGVASVIGLKAENVHVVWVPGPGSFGRSDADDTAAEAAVIAKATGRPVRVQGCANTPPPGTRKGRPAFTPPAPRSIKTATFSPTTSSPKVFPPSTSIPTAASRRISGSAR